MAKCATIAAAERLTSAPKPEPFMVTGPRAQAATPAMKDAPRPRGAEGDRSLARAAKGRAIF
jgi:L-asparaginase II